MAGSDSLKNGEKTKRRVGDGTPGPGRPKGLQNKTTVIAKEAIAAAFDRLGGTDRLVKWCKADEKNESAFWTTIYPKLLPLQLTGEGGGPVALNVTNLTDDQLAALAAIDIPDDH